MPIPEKPWDWVAQARLAMALIPQDGTEARNLMQRRDALLAGMTPQRRWAVLTPGNTTS